VKLVRRLIAAFDRWLFFDDDQRIRRGW